jgi:DNA-binding transcriptional ArsR family regulator
MLRLWLEAADLARVRVGEDLHPAGTVMLASQALRDPAVAASMPRLARRIAAAAQPLRALHHLVPPKGFLPDFLTPRDGVDSLEAGLAAIRSATPKRIRSEIAAAYTQVPVSAMRRRFAAADPEVLDALVAATRHYFQEVLSPYWPAMRHAYRSRSTRPRAASRNRGSTACFGGCRQGCCGGRRASRSTPGRPGTPGASATSASAVEGSSWCPRRSPDPVPACSSSRTNLPGRLPVRRIAGSRVAPPTDDPIDRLLGRTRAAVLRCVERPGRHTTSVVAGEVGISVPSSSEHLTTLRAAGLVSSHRAGGAVVHRITALGSELLTRRASGQDGWGGPSASR